jgi:RNA polymerase sigma-70 factor (ECF subfamily)
MKDERDRTDEELAQAAKRGESIAYDALVRRYLRPAMAVAWQYVRRVEDSEDIVQESFHRVVRALADYDDERPFGAWFYAIVRNVARTAVSKDSRRAGLAPLSLLEDDMPAPTVVDPGVVGDIERAIESLAPMQQACVRLCDIEGFTSVEASQMLGVDDGTVRTHLHRARKQLRAAMSL